MQLNIYKKSWTCWVFEYSRICLFVLVLLFSFTSWGAIDNVVMEGIVVSYDKKTVTLLQKHGQKVKVPRKSIPKHIKLKTGIKVSAHVDSQKLMKKIRKMKAKEQKKLANPKGPK